MKVPLQDLSRGYAEIREEIEREILRVAASARYVLGPEVEAFERELAEFLGVRFVVSCGSGTDAILLALAAMEIGEGDEVITSPFTFFSTAATIFRLGARPVFADLDDETLTLSTEAVRRALTPRTRAILPVHLYGQPADVAGIRSIAQEAGVRVVEDCAQAIGAASGGQQIGACGDIGCFSFYPTKNLGAFGDGGGISTDSETLAEKVRLLRMHGSSDGVEHPVVGINSRLDTIQAAVLRVKLPRLAGWNEERRATARFYDEAVSDLSIRTPPRREEALSIYHQYTIRTEERDLLRNHLEASGVGSGIYYPLPLHLQPCFEELGYKEGDFPVTEKAAREVLSIPVFPGLTPEEARHVASALHR